MIERVRAVLVTPDGCLLAIRRDRPGRATYWVLLGGHVDPGDQSLEAALSREISKEIAGEAEITSLVQVLESGAGDERQYFYLGRITSWDFTSRTGPEFGEPGRGSYQLKQIPLTAAGLGVIDLQPTAIARLLRDVITTSGRDLFTLPDLRSGPAAQIRGGT